MTLSILLTGIAISTAPACDLNWLEGHWVSYDEGRWSEEVWLAERGGMMLGTGRSGSANGRGSFEYLRIGRSGDTLTYWAAPGGGETTAFTATEQSCNGLTVENREHDYPQRIRYERDGDMLKATISNADGSNAISWSYSRQ